MRRTTIFLPKELHERLHAKAFRARVSMAELIRARLERGSHRRAQKPVPKRGPLLDVIGIIHDGTLTQNLDEDLYGPDSD